MKSAARSRLTALLVVGMVLTHVTVSSALVIQKVSDYRDSTERHLGVLADAAALALVEAFAFDDRQLATRDLETFGADPNIELVCLWDRQGLEFARFEAPHAGADLACEHLRGEEDQFSWRVFQWERPLRFEGERLGTFSIRAVPAPLREELATTVLLSLALLAGSIALALFLSRRVLRELENEVGRRTRALVEATDRAFEASRAKSRFMANMSHELRTPMNGILGTIERMRESGLDPGQTDLADRAFSSGRHLLDVLNNVLDFSKAEATNIEVSLDECDLETLLTSLIETHVDTARLKGISLELRTDDGVPRWIRANSGGLLRILHNLIGNAVKFTSHGGVVLHVERLPGEMLRFWVRDTGIGIEEQAATRLFTPFSQVDDSTTRRFGGTGLGLAISRQVVEAMGGKIGFTSDPGQGSAFWFTLPAQEIEPGDELAEDADAASGAHEPPVLSGEVLLVEDHEINLEIAESAIAATGCRVTSVVNGKLAVQAASRSHFDAILMDCHMPVMDGFEATRRIRSFPSTSPTSADVPILAVTANARSEEIVRCLAEGMNEVVTKPFSRMDLWNGLAAILPGQAGLATAREDATAPSESAPAVAGEARVLDPARLDEIRQIEPGSELLAEILQMFLDQSEAALEALERAAASGSGEELRVTAHGLKGSCANLGATRMAEQCALLEKRGLAGQAAEASMLVELRELHERTCRAIRRELEG